MRDLKLKEIIEVQGGNGEGESQPTASETVAANAATAVAVCGAGNVASVTVSGFACKGGD